MGCYGKGNFSIEAQRRKRGGDREFFDRVHSPVFLHSLFIFSGDGVFHIDTEDGEESNECFFSLSHLCVFAVKIPMKAGLSPGASKEQANVLTGY